MKKSLTLIALGLTGFAFANESESKIITIPALSQFNGTIIVGVALDKYNPINNDSSITIALDVYPLKSCFLTAIPTVDTPADRVNFKTNTLSCQDNHIKVNGFIVDPSDNKYGIKNSNGKPDSNLIDIETGTKAIFVVIDKFSLKY